MSKNLIDNITLSFKSLPIEQQEILTLEMEAIALGREDPVFFAKYFLGIELNPFQIRYLHGTLNSKQNLVACGNQTGKTVVISVLHIWFNFYKIYFVGDPNIIDSSHYQTLNLSPISRQAKEAYRYVNEILHSNFTWEIDKERFVNKCRIEWFFAGTNENLGRIEFSNHSVFNCLSTHQDRGAGIQGAQFALITYDECVQSLHLREELPARIFSRTSKYNGRVDLIATPDEQANSQQYWFHITREAEKGLSGWKLLTGLYDENIFIPEDKKKDYKERLFRLDPERYKQVVLGQFTASATRMFSPDMVEGFWNGKPAPAKNNLPAVPPDHEYIIPIDWGVADQGDDTVMLPSDITDSDNAEVVYVYKIKGGDPIELIAMAGLLKQHFNNAKIIMDTSALGGTIFKKLMANLNPMSFKGQNKADALFYLQVRLRNNIRKDLTGNQKNAIGKLKSFYDPDAEEQLASYKIDDKHLKQDFVMTLAILAYYLEKYKTSSKFKTFPLSYFNK